MKCNFLHFLNIKNRSWIWKLYFRWTHTENWSSRFRSTKTGPVTPIPVRHRDSGIRWTNQKSGVCKVYGHLEPFTLPIYTYEYRIKRLSICGSQLIDGYRALKIYDGIVFSVNLSTRICFTITLEIVKYLKGT